MPFVRIMTGDCYTEMQKKQISDILHQALTETFAVPAQDRFHFFECFAARDRYIDRYYLSTGRTEGAILFNIIAGKPRSNEQKAALYRQLATQLNEKMGIEGGDVMVVIQFTAAEDWSFSGGKRYHP
ncbi:tautomerase family protein [Enterobacter chuandaensis]|uniref:Tautomerase family protein n=1 Tax=Enterobacter chuandaensis TaxID=2497875 RepID=A0AA96M7V7_9ENTR|nr:tautomerase family protein [Enterobacter chuandaensis]MCW4783750.1 tautomerase family protein [Enterobacter chuandaensis]MDA4757953.1 tautomerase family protein [Enterobacter chuandaensis]WNS38608.1 tautomerase family protein [Enterobacter chuandaensis]